MNNRQNGRRRGRGGGQPPRGQSNGPDRGNRIDSRARGNASQLYEKYKSLARDSQTQGDRVTTEYYLQFADHYFRVLNENRARFEEQRPRRDDMSDDARDEFDDDMFDDGDADQPHQQPPSRQPESARDDRYREDRPDRQDRQDRQERPARQERSDRQEYAPRQEQAPRQDQAGRQEQAPRQDYSGRQDRQERRPRRDQREPAPRFETNEQPAVAETVAAAPLSAPVTPEAREDRTRRRRTRGNGDAPPANDAVAPIERIDIDRLPPAFAAEPRVEPVPANDGDAAEGKPRVRRPRRPRGDTAAATVDV